MSKKVKCKECENMMNWSLPESITNFNYEYAKHCLDIAKSTFVCGITMKTKRRDNEQYCKHFEKSIYNMEDLNNKRLLKLEEMIKEYETKVGKNNG